MLALQQQNFLSQKPRKQIQKMMDFGELQNELDDIGYIPTALRKDQTTRSRPVSLSRQNSTKSIGSMKDTKEQDPQLRIQIDKAFDSLFDAPKRQSPKNRSSSPAPEPQIQAQRRKTLFGAHKDSATKAQSPSNKNPPPYNPLQPSPPMSFQQFLKPSKPTQDLSRPPLPQPKKLQKQSSFTQLSSPEGIIDDDLNNSSVASRRGRPPLSRRGQNASGLNNESDWGLGNGSGLNNVNRSEIVGGNVGMGQTVGFGPKVGQSVKQQPFYRQSAKQQGLNAPMPPLLSQTQPLPNSAPMFPSQSFEQLKKLFSNQLQLQKQSFESLIKQQRQSHQSEIQKLKQLHSEEVKRKLQIKDFELQKMKEFYEMQLKVQNQRNQQVQEYSSIRKKLQGNIQSIQNMQKTLKNNQFRLNSDKQQQKTLSLTRKQLQISHKLKQLQQTQAHINQQLQSFNKQKLSHLTSLTQQKHRLYELESDLRKRQAELLAKYRKLEAQLSEEYDKKGKMLEKEREELRMEELTLREQRNLVEVEKQELINGKKLWDNEKKNYLQELHGQRTKVIEKQIQLASRAGQIQIKEQEIMMNQAEYTNKIKLIELEKKKLQIQKKTSKGQLYTHNPNMRTHGLLGTSLLNKGGSSFNKTSQLQKQFYSNEQYEQQGFEPQQPNYKKSITQMRDEFLKSLPKF